MQAETVAVLDVGKTNTKVVVFDASLGIVEVDSMGSRSDGVHLDTAASWQFLHGKLREIAARYRLSAIVPTTHGAAFALLRDGRLAHPVVDYEQPVPPAISAAYDAVRPPFAESFSPSLPLGLNAGRQIFALAHAEPELVSLADTLIPYAQYFAWKLSGEAACEVSSLGCHTDLWAPLQGRPSLLCGAMGWDRLLAPVVPAWATLGPPLPELGLPPSCRVLAGAHDSNAAFLRYLAGSAEPFSVVSTGTWFICFNTQGEVAGLDERRDTLANVDVLGRPVASARYMGGRDYGGIAGAAGLAARPDAAALRKIVSAGIQALPAALAADGRGRHCEIRGTPANDAERQALAALYCALMTVEMLALTGPVETVYVDGPFAGNTLYLGALANLLAGASVHASEVAHGTSIGAALLAHWPAEAGKLPRHRLEAHPVAPLDLDLEPYRARWRALVAERAASGHRT